MAKAGRIQIDLSAGTAQFVLDMEQANRKLNELGNAHVRAGAAAHASVSGMQASSAAIRVLEGNVTNNIRAAERFIGTLPGVSSALKAAFPVVGAIALTGVIFELGKKVGEVYDAFEKIKNAPSAINEAFGKLNNSVRTSNDELQVTNDRLASEIAKLQGKPQNGLKLALDEAKVAADKLAESIDKDLTEVQKLLKENSVGLFGGIFSGTAPTKDIEKQFGGANGYGGFREETNIITAKGNEEIRQATTLKDRDAAQTRLNTALQAQYGKELSYVNSEIKKSQDLIALSKADPSASPFVADQGARLAELRGLQANLSAEVNRFALTSDNAKLEGQKSILEAAKANTPKERTDYYGNAVAELQQRIKAAQEEGRVSSNPLTEAIAKGAAKATEEVARLNEELTKAKETPLTRGQQLTIGADNLQLSVIQLVSQQKAKAAAKEQEDAKKLLEIEGKEVGILVEQGVGMDANTQKERTRQNEIGKTIDKLDAQNRAVQYQIAAAGKGIDAQRAAELAGVAAKAGAADPEREGQLPSERILAAIAQQQAKYQLQDAISGRNDDFATGFRRFFQQFEDNNQSAGNQVQQVLGGAFKGLDTQLTDLITGQKTNWSSFFRGISADIASLAVNNIFTSLFKTIGTASTGGLGGIIGAIFGGFKADGGDVSGGRSYIVGESGPELFTPGGSGSITPNKALSGSGSVTYNIDARGAENSAATELRVQRAIAQARQQGAQDGARLQREKQARVPNAKKAFA